MQFNQRLNVASPRATRTHARTHTHMHALLAFEFDSFVVGLWRQSQWQQFGEKKKQQHETSSNKTKLHASKRQSSKNQSNAIHDGRGGERYVRVCMHVRARVYAPQNDVWSEDESLACEDCCLLKRSEAVGTCRQQQQQQQQCAEEYGHVEVCERRVRWRIACL